MSIAQRIQLAGALMVVSSLLNLGMTLTLGISLLCVGGVYFLLPALLASLNLAIGASLYARPIDVELVPVVGLLASIGACNPTSMVFDLTALVLLSGVRGQLTDVLALQEAKGRMAVWVGLSRSDLADVLPVDDAPLLTENPWLSEAAAAPVREAVRALDGAPRGVLVAFDRACEAREGRWRGGWFVGNFAMRDGPPDPAWLAFLDDALGRWASGEPRSALRVTTAGDATLGLIADHPSVGVLETLTLERSGLSRRGVRALVEAQLDGLRALALDGERALDDAGLAALVEAPWARGLQSLRLADTSVSPTGLLRVAALPGLRDLDVDLPVHGRLADLHLQRVALVSGGALASLLGAHAATLRSVTLRGDLGAEGASAVVACQGIDALAADELGPAALRMLGGGAWALRHLRLGCPRAVEADWLAWRESRCRPSVVALSGDGLSDEVIGALTPLLAGVDDLALAGRPDRPLRAATGALLRRGGLRRVALRDVTVTEPVIDALAANGGLEEVELAVSGVAAPVLQARLGHVPHLVLR